MNGTTAARVIREFSAVFDYQPWNFASASPTEKVQI
jgi:hypothetical protein